MPPDDLIKELHAHGPSRTDPPGGKPIPILSLTAIIAGLQCRVLLMPGGLAVKRIATPLTVEQPTEQIPLRAPMTSSKLFVLRQLRLGALKKARGHNCRHRDGNPLVPRARTAAGMHVFGIVAPLARTLNHARPGHHVGFLIRGLPHIGWIA